MNPISYLRFMPRWVIFFVDLFLTGNALVLAYLLRYNFQTELIDGNDFSRGVTIGLLVYAVCFLVFQSFAGIIRHTNTQDAGRIWLTSTIAAILLYAVGSVTQRFYPFMLMPTSVVIIHYLTVFLLLTGYRILIKEIFAYAPRFACKKENVLIFGAGDLGLTTLRVITQERTHPWKVVAFVDDNPKKVSKKLDGIDIFPTAQLPHLIRKHQIRQVIIAARDLSLRRRHEVIDLSLENGAKASAVPSVNEWLNGTFQIHQIENIKIEDLLEREPIQLDNDEIGRQIRDKRILITGAAGSIGSEIVRQLARYSPRVLLLVDQAETALNDLGLKLQEEYPELSFRMFIGSVTNKLRMEFIFENFGPDLVFHAAAFKHVPMMEDHPREAVVNNVMGTKVIADLSVEYGVDKFIMVSTDKAVNPTNIMGASKRLAEIYTQSYGKSGKTATRFITTRFGNVLGSNGSVIPRFKSQIENGGPITVTHPDITRYFMTIPEACQLVLEAAAMGKGGEIFVFDMGKSVRIVDMARKMIVLAGLEPDRDIQIKFTGLRPGEKLYEEVLSDVEPTRPTYNAKIMIAETREYDFEYVQDSILSLIEAAMLENDWKTVRLMKRMIPEFVSNNSKFERLDIQMAQERREVTRRALYP
ncbi:MAG TPA: nucleoside-diphosphate sugar epimerase/dehydratase [Dinghuibacter sp.]|uniref:polysaccharide biosynthesis protein n=1 Tax=Dinghuibacter sp. TaxID=2024697 RepID=UPI002BE9EA73|nr:nucleoside-diphosphate sugar epimerase/dehydratase [Dinghuibacter sp.]HTJ10948.1 nucleoside-diphosphate sugar epimerase/dehydratase [Dinghuibacter sp.]